MQKTRNAAVSIPAASLNTNGIIRTPIIGNIIPPTNTSIIQEAITTGELKQAEQIAQSTLEKFMRRTKINVEIATQEEVIAALALSEMSKNSHLISLLAQFKVKCTSAHIPIKNINSLIKLKIQELEKLIADTTQQMYHQHTQNLLQKGKISAPLPINKIIFPPGFIPDWERSVMLDTNSQVIFPFIPLISESIDPDDKNNAKELTVATQLPGDDWKYTTASRQTFFHPGKIMSLTDEEFPVSFKKSYDLSDYLYNFDILNKNIIPRVCTVNQPGWHKGIFIYPGNYSEGYRLDKKVKEIVEEVFVSSGGNIQELLEIIKYLKSIDVANIAWGTILSAPLVHVLDVDNIHIHIVCDKGSGKTTMSQLIFAAFGNPRVKNAIFGPNSTVTRNELRIASRRDLPVILEDIHNIKDTKERDKMRRLIMDWGNDDARQRSNTSLQQVTTNEYRGSLLTTSEHMITTFNDDGGIKRRVVELAAPNPIIPFERVRNLKKIAWNNYGLIGKKWIEIILENQDEMRLMYENLYERQLIIQFSDKVPRHLSTLAVIAVVNVFFDVYFLQMDMSVAEKLEMSCIERIIQQLPKDIEISEHERAKLIIVEWIQSHPKGFAKYVKNEYSHLSSSQEWFNESESYDSLGIIKDDFIGVYPEKLKDMLRNRGFNVEDVIRRLTEEGFILKGKNQITQSTKIEGVRKYFYRLNHNEVWAKD